MGHGWTRRGVLGAGLAAGLVGVAPARATGTAFDVADGFGLRVVGNQRVDARLGRLRFETAEVFTGPGATVLLPAGYDDHPTRRYPLLFLFHGGGADHTQWTAQLDAAAATLDHEVIVVMPDCNLVGWYADHLYPTGGPRNWKTFHLEQLLPWVEANFRTLGVPSARAVAGLSMGGYGAQKYAAEYPDRFAAVSSYSGPSNNIDPVLEMWIFTTVGLDAQLPGAVYGHPLAHHAVMKRENPMSNLESFRGKRVVLYAGRPPLLSADPAADAQERVVHSQNTQFSKRLTEAGIAHAFHSYPGTHTGAYWSRNFREDLPGLVAALDPASG